MTTRIFGLAVALAVIFLASSPSAFAQWSGGRYMGRSDNPVGPTVSPYLNLTQGGSVTNYQSLVKPLLEQDSAIRRQGASLNNLQRQVSQQAYGGGGRGGRGTGHATFFMNYSHYYPQIR